MSDRRWTGRLVLDDGSRMCGNIESPILPHSVPTNFSLEEKKWHGELGRLQRAFARAIENDHFRLTNIYLDIEAGEFVS